MPAKQLYFIALVPPEPLLSEAWRLKEYFRDTYGSKASLNSPPHITLHAPFQLINEEEALIGALQQTAEGFRPFEVALKDFAAFAPRVIYIDVEKSQKMEELQQKLQPVVAGFAEDNRQQGERGFHPHMTLAFRDLSKSSFYKAWEEFREKELSFRWQAESFVLLKHNGKYWEEHTELKLGK